MMSTDISIQGRAEFMNGFSLYKLIDIVFVSHIFHEI